MTREVKELCREREKGRNLNFALRGEREKRRKKQRKENEEEKKSEENKEKKVYENKKV